MRRKVLHVTQATGGIETILLLLFKHCDKDRFDVHLACPPNTSLARRARQLGVRVFEIPMVRRVNPIRDLLGLVQLIRLIRRERYAIVHGHSAKGGYLARIAGLFTRTGSVVYAPQAFSYLSQAPWVRPFFLALEKLVIPATDLLIASSDSEKRRAIEEVGFCHSRVVVIPNSVDFDETPPNSNASVMTRPTVLTIGRFSYQKNPQMFVRVAELVLKRLQNVRFVMVGGGFAGPDEPNLRKTIEARGLRGRVIIEPWCERSHALALLSECSVFVLTSRFEGMPNTVLEAMMLAKPVVVTDVDGSRDVVSDGATGAVVPLEDDQAMADRIVQLLTNEGLAGEMGRNGRAIAEARFEVRRNVRELERLYELFAVGAQHE